MTVEMPSGLDLSISMSLKIKVDIIGINRPYIFSNMMGFGYLSYVCRAQESSLGNRAKTLYVMLISQFLIYLLACVSQLLD